MKNFKELRIWQNGKNIAVNCLKIVKDFPQQEKFGLAIQITRSVVSIPSNIPEGSRRSSEKYYRHFAEISLVSSYEPGTHLLIAQRVAIGDQDLTLKTLTDVSEEQKMLFGFINKLGR